MTEKEAEKRTDRVNEWLTEKRGTIMPGETYTDEEMQERYASTDDKRVAENNVMRHEYRTLNDDEKNLMTEMKDIGREFIELCDSQPASRELSLAKTKMEEAVMWGVKAITK